MSERFVSDLTGLVYISEFSMSDKILFQVAWRKEWQHGPVKLCYLSDVHGITGYRQLEK